MLFDSGLCEIWLRTANTSDGKMPTYSEILFGKVYFGDLKVGITRFYAARREHVQLDRLIRIWRCDAVRPNDKVIIEDKTYSVVQVQHSTDSDGFEVTDLSLTLEVKI